MWQGHQLERTSIPLWSHCGDGTQLQLEEVLSQVIDVLSHSLGPLPSALSAADWLFRNSKEGTPVSAITTLSEAFWERGIYHYCFVIMDFEAVETVQLGHSNEMNGWHQMLEKGVRRKLTCHCELQTLLSYFQEWPCVSTSHCQYEEAEGRIFHLARAGKYGNKAVTICSDDTDIFVMPLMFQYKISVLLIKQFRTKTMVDVLTLQSCGHYWYLGKPIFHIPYSHRMSHSIFFGSREDHHFHLLDQQ